MFNVVKLINGRDTGLDDDDHWCGAAALGDVKDWHRRIPRIRKADRAIDIK